MRGVEILEGLSGPEDAEGTGAHHLRERLREPGPFK